MNKLALLFGMIMMTAPAHADITHRMSSSVQLTVDAAASQATRIGSSYTASGNNIEVTTMGGLTAPASATAAADVRLVWLEMVLMLERLILGVIRL